MDIMKWWEESFYEKTASTRTAQLRGISATNETK